MSLPLFQSAKGIKYLVRSKKLNGQVHKVVLMSLQFITLEMQGLVKNKEPWQNKYNF